MSYQIWLYLNFFNLYDKIDHKQYLQNHPKAGAKYNLHRVTIQHIIISYKFIRKFFLKEQLNK